LPKGFGFVFVCFVHVALVGCAGNQPASSTKSPEDEEQSSCGCGHAAVARMAKVGLIPRKDFDPSKLDLVDKEAIKTVPKLSVVKIMKYFKKSEKPVNGWLFTTKTVIYETAYLQRALITTIGLGAKEVRRSRAQIRGSLR
jgi:hypothetical protein